jgi:hypothetical protein
VDPRAIRKNGVGGDLQQASLVRPLSEW